MVTLDDYRRLFDLSTNRAVVIGAGSGIGEACARALAAHGAEVLCADLDGEATRAVAAAIAAEGGTATAATVNILDATTVTSMLDEFGVVDTMVCTPSINVRKQLLDMSEEEFSRVVDLNLRGTFNAITAAGRRMAGRGSGSIMVFSSVRSQVVEPGQGAYAATKAGALAMVKTLAAELGPKGVRVNAIGPGVVETPLTEQIKANDEWYQAYADISALGRWSQPEEQTGIVIYLASAASSFVTGALHLVDGGWLAVDGRYTPPL